MFAPVYSVTNFHDVQDSVKCQLALAETLLVPWGCKTTLTLVALSTTMKEV